MKATSAPERGATAEQFGALLGAVEQAATAYERPDLGDRVSRLRGRPDDSLFRVVVIGEFKAGKSSLINALLGAAICPVDDDIATARATVVRFATEPSAAVVLDGSDDAVEDSRRENLHLDDLTAVVTGSGPVELPASWVEVGIPRLLLQGGMTFVDTPGVGGSASAHQAATMAMLPTADAIVFVSDASRELTQTEIQFLTTAAEFCANILFALTKVDFYPHWRTILDLNAAHLDRASLDGAIYPIATALRDHALRESDREMNDESGIPPLLAELQALEAAKVADREREGCAQMLEIVADLERQLDAHRQALTDPERGETLVRQLSRTEADAERFRVEVSGWQQTLTDGITDLTATVDHDLRDRFRGLAREADGALEDVDAAKVWGELEPWLRERVSEEVASNYALLFSETRDLAVGVSEHFQIDYDEVTQLLDSGRSSELLASVGVGAEAEFEASGIASRGLSALRGSYGGVLMFGMLGKMAGVAILGPVAVPLGFLMGAKTMKDERERRTKQHRAEATQAYRQYADEVLFKVAQDSRLLIRTVQRALRDHFSQLAADLQASTAAALRSAKQAMEVDPDLLPQRIEALESDIELLTALNERIIAMARNVAMARDTA